MNIRTIKTCRSCDSHELVEVISFGDAYVSDFLKKTEKAKKAPLNLVVCTNCWLLQLRHTVTRTDLYTKYWYVSGMNESMIDALTDITDNIKKLVKLEAGDVVIDIGSNDSSLLRTYRQPSIYMIGYEPAKNLMKLARAGSIPNMTIINEFFSSKKGYQAKAITSIAMLYDVDEPNQFVEDIKKSLLPEGIWIIQMAYTPTMFDGGEYDTLMCHEHLCDYSILSLEHLLGRHSLEIFKVEKNYVNAGSFRIYVQFKGGKQNIDKSVKEMREKEIKEGYNSLKPYMKFAKKTKAEADIVHDFIAEQVKLGKKVYGYGASTKGNYILQYSRLDNKLITAISDRNPMKLGLYTVGTKIPIISEEQARKEKPDFFLILPYTFVKEFVDREKEFLNNGGIFIIPVNKDRGKVNKDKIVLHPLIYKIHRHGKMHLVGI